ncbi:DctP family TRAP transporter solute-binding subunit [Paracoccus sp. S1E-3]|uniref:DctP family TRAP transporter solute-binding subunit n=1 Tax=Paracoccus sp. S1E-3 TaxID=2756130 RepID=UPI0015EEAE0C|nr:DctP family TRAP transporter solute-binding subunit [Paracoccus sp. S1E-3]MBA4491781.1 DctP family TRAP transporter solute-binding subunit [Paracoccus sp. S1E-3]
MTTFFRTAGLAAVLALTAFAAQAQTTLKLAHPVPETDLQQNLALEFKRVVEEKTGGEVTVQIFPNGQLGNDQQMIDGTRAGIIDVSLIGLNNYTGLVPEAGAFELPFIFPTREVAYKVLDGAPGQEVAKQMETHGLKLLGYGENGYRNMTNNRGPIRVPDDLKGLRMRVNNSKALNDMFELLGANPQQLPVAELYTALETGVVDAQDHPIGVVVSFKFNEVQKYLSLTQHAYSALGLTMNKAKFDNLTPEQQAAVTEAAKAAIDLQRGLVQAKEEEMIAGLEAEGMEVNRDVDAAAFQAAIKPVWDNYVAENGDVLLNQVLETAK